MLALIAAALFVMLNGFFVAAEFALVKAKAAHLLASERRGDRRAAVARDIIGRLERYLGATQFGITVASLGLGWVVEPLISATVAKVPIPAVGGAPERLVVGIAIAVAFFFVTLVHVLLGELVPKLYAIQRADRVALFVARPVRMVYVVFRPVLFVLEAATRLILRSMGLSAEVANRTEDAEAEVLEVLSTLKSSPAARSRGDLVERVIRFSRRTARHAMVPRVDVASLPIDTAGVKAAHFLRKQQFSRVIVTRDRSLDDVVGYLYAKDFLLNPDAERASDLSTLKREVLFVPETLSAPEVLRKMQSAESPIAVVVDEYGGTSGLVTMEDLLEEIVGEIKDELDEEPTRIMRLPGTVPVWEIDGHTAMEELRPLGVDVAEADSAELVGASVVERLGRLPRLKDKVAIGGATLEVTAIQRRRVLRVRLTLGAEPARSSSGC